MSQRNQNVSGSNYNTRSPARTQNIEHREAHQSSRYRQQRTERDLHYESPTRHDIDFYVRKVNRLENDVADLQNQLSLTRFKLNKAEDYEIKYESIFKQNQNILANNDHLSQDNLQKKKQIEELMGKLAQSDLKVRNQQNQINTERNLVEDLRKMKDQIKYKVTNEGAQEKATVEDTYIRKIETLRRQARQKEQKYEDQLNVVKTELIAKQNIETTLNYKLQKIKNDKNEEIERLKQLIFTLREQLTNSKKESDEKLTNYRTTLISQTEDRIAHFTSVSKTIEESMLEEIRNLNEAIKKKDQEISFLIESDKKFMEDNEQIQNDLKEHIKRLQDKIFIIQRENQLEIFKNIQRLTKQYEDNINNINNDMDRIKQSHQQKVNHLQQEIDKLKKENSLLDKQAKTLEKEHSKIAKDKQSAIDRLSQTIIKLESMKDLDHKQYTASLREIQQDVKTKLDDLHAAIDNKNTQFDILNAQLALKNQQLNHLIDQINNLRSVNRQKLRKLETTNSLEQNSLNEMNSSLKKETFELKRRIHQLENELDDKQAQYQLKIQLLKEELVLQKQANEKYKSKNNFLETVCKQLQVALKQQRVGNVNILHDQSVSRRETIQTRQQVKIQMQVIKNKEVEQIKNIFRLEKNRLQSDLQTKQHQLRDKKAELNRLLVEYKNLQKKVGKSSKLDKGSEQNGKCQATLDAQILLTENIFNAINRP